MAADDAEKKRADLEQTRADTNGVRADADYIRAETEQIREDRHAEADERLEAENKARFATLRDRLRTKVHLIPMALILVGAVVGLVLVLRYA